MVSAEGRQAASLAAHGLDGALHRRIAEIRGRLLDLAAHLTAYVDYPEEDVEELTGEQFSWVVDSEMKNMEKLIDSYQDGAILRHGIQAVIVGSPNVGKSSLFNLITGYDRSIVTQEAGTTRDVVREQVQLGRVLLNLADTAGIHASDNAVEKEGIRRSGLEVERASLVIVVFDGSMPFGEEERQLAMRCAGKTALCVVNKNDLPQIITEKELRPYFSHIIWVSALRQNTVEVLENAIFERLQMHMPQEGSLLIANQRQLAAAVAARDALAGAGQALGAGYPLDVAGVHLDEALRALAQLTGEDVTDSVLDEVFSKFCVGK